MTLPTPIDVGYFPKTTKTSSDWLKAPVVEEICSVSECISPGPREWILKWRHNDLGFFDTEAVALLVAGDDRAMFDLYAYRVYPLELDNGVARPWRPPIGPLALDLRDYEFLGHDIASRSAGRHCECSPLSCNGAAAEYPVNRFCLIAECSVAYQAAIDISKGNYEPGPYHLFEVHRRRQGG